MDIKEIHYAIESNLHELGSYQYGDYETEDIDLAINGVVYQIYNKLTTLKPEEYDNISATEQAIFEFLNKEVCSIPTKEGDYYRVTPPLDWENISNVTIKGYDTSCSRKVSKIEEGKVYRAKTDTLYNSKWYKPCEFFKANAGTEIYGEVEEVKEAINPSKAVPLLSINGYLSSSLKVSYWAKDKQGIKIASPNLKVNEVCYSYMQSSKNIGVNYCEDKTLELDEAVIYNIIDLTVQRLSIRVEANQQKIVNLKTETL